jgi:hypothetical protein
MSNSIQPDNENIKALEYGCEEVVVFIKDIRGYGRPMKVAFGRPVSLVGARMAVVVQESPYYGPKISPILQLLQSAAPRMMLSDQLREYLLSQLRHHLPLRLLHVLCPVLTPPRPHPFFAQHNVGRQCLHRD